MVWTALFVGCYTQMNKCLQHLMCLVKHIFTVTLTYPYHFCTNAPTLPAFQNSQRWASCNTNKIHINSDNKKDKANKLHDLRATREKHIDICKTNRCSERWINLNKERKKLSCRRVVQLIYRMTFFKICLIYTDSSNDLLNCEVIRKWYHFIHICTEKYCACASLHFRALVSIR